MPELYASQCTMTVHGVHHQGMDLNVFIVPHPTVWQWRIVGTGVDRTVAGIDDTPATLGTYLAHGGARMWHLVSGPKRVRRAVEAIGCRYRTDFDRFKQDVVTGISTHAACFSFVVIALRSRIPNVSLRFGSIEGDGRGYFLNIDIADCRCEYFLIIVG